MFELRPYRKNNSVSYYNPFRDMESFEKAFFGDPYYRNALAEFKTDITDEGDHFLLEADMPGFEKNDIHLDVSGDTLTIKAERLTKNKTEDKKDRSVCSERSYGSYSRSFDITGIDAHEGDTVTVFGEGAPVGEMADVLGTIPYEIMTGISTRVKRIYTKE